MKINEEQTIVKISECPYCPFYYQDVDEDICR
jgi:hypothetical protein